MVKYLSSALLWSLSFLAVFTSSATAQTPQPEPTPPQKSVYLRHSSDWKFKLNAKGAPANASDSSLLLRQIFRQAMLIAARDELGLTTRDADIGDKIPRNEDKPVLVMGARHKKNPRVYLKRIKPKKYYDLPFQYDGNYLHAVITAEEASRQSYVEALKDFGLKGEPNRHINQTEVPGQIKRLLSKMTFTSQYQAVRSLHQLIRRDGESDALLGALVRGYSNLGWLTETQWLAAPSVFKARALLYAQRMVARGEHPSWALRHRAYALAATGLHAMALADLQTAAKVESKSETDSADLNQSPEWVDVIDAHCHFKLAKLDPEKVAPSCRELAELLRLINIELSNGAVAGQAKRTQNVEAAVTAVEAMPECYRAHDSLAGYSSVGIGHESTVAGLSILGDKLYARIAIMPDLPPQIRQLIAVQASADQPLGRLLGAEKIDSDEEYVLRGNLIKALMDVGNLQKEKPSASSDEQDRSNADAPQPLIDDGEPSWATLGYLIREVSFLQAWRRVHFLRKSLAVEPDSFVASMWPMVDTHPYRVLLKAYLFDRQVQRNAIQQLSKLNLKDFDRTAMDIHNILRLLDRKKATQAHRFMALNTDAVTRQQVIKIGYRYSPNALKYVSRSLHAMSPYCPTGRAGLLKYDWKRVAKKAKRWERDATGQSFFVLEVLGDQYTKQKRYDDARRCYEAAIELCPDKTLYQKLAQVYQLQGDTDRWLATLEQCLKQPDYGLGHARIRCQIAEYLLTQGKEKLALQYAEEAAQTYAAWALGCAADCHEALGHWEQAEAYIRAKSERYRSSQMDWYLFCRRTGQGNLDEARELADQFARQFADESNHFAVIVKIALYHWLEGRPQEASKRLAKYAKLASGEPTSCYFYAAIAADQSGDAELRDKLLKKTIASGNKIHPPKNGHIDIWSALAGLMVDDLAAGGKGNFNFETYEKMIASLPPKPALAMDFHYLFAKYLQLHGQEEKAIHYWKRCLALRPIFYQARILAGSELIARNYGPDCYRTLDDEKKPADTKKQTDKNSDQE